MGFKTLKTFEWFIVPTFFPRYHLELIHRYSTCIHTRGVSACVEVVWLIWIVCVCVCVCVCGCVDVGVCMDVVWVWRLCYRFGLCGCMCGCNGNN